ncbi:hypothetical protein GGP85_002963 [Salinibacter ruber]|uniref:sulfotransferase domain-containing protein n=1 Tax=Salinibacter ruber TaxID=146919 RepID=UPI00216A7EBA|nr:sulfotransferase domain-containing protein [Salinibacter ruber]MCS3827493.1 hypothetical protein [Salinibacter ruber]
MGLFGDVVTRVGRAARQAVKRSIAAVGNRHRPGEENDLLILSSPRSGSTWLMELIYTQPGIKYIDEPLAKHILEAENIFPLKPCWRYVDLTATEKATLTDYLKNDRLVRRFGPRNVLADEYDYFTDRRVLKLIRTCSLLPWFAENSGFEVIYLIRHPIPQALSAIRRDHDHHLRAYSSALSSDVYGTEAQDVIDSLDATSTVLKAFVTAWCLENIVPLQYVTGRSEVNVFVLTYEELVMNPEVVLEKLAAKLRLERLDRMMEHVSTPSAVTDTTTHETKERIREGDRGYLVRKWKQQVTEEQENDLFSILDAFDVDAYRPGRFLAQGRFLHGKEVEV